MSTDEDDEDFDYEPIELPESVKEMVVRRMQELRDDPSIGLTYDEVWKQIRSRYPNLDSPETST